MRVALSIDDELLDQVVAYTESSNRSEAVRIALNAYVRRQKIEQILAMRGTMEFDGDVEELRALETGHG